MDVVAADYKLRKDAVWFGEAQSRVVVSVKSTKVANFKKAMGDHPYEELGVVTTGSIEIDGMYWGEIEAWKQKYDTAIENLMTPQVDETALSFIP